ncbi:MAG TPA: pyridoxal-phosphate dependent enzyme [Sorangium sp.]|nr:pyridoxal-phosphate dependent enzyme [Sorangium sp.]
MLTINRPLLELWPRLRTQVLFARLAKLPTPVEPVAELAVALGCQPGALWEKRDDLSSRYYGGNKVRTLETLLAKAVANHCERVYATGAYGSNHAIATAIHAPRLGLDTGAAVYPQPPTPAAKENLRALLSQNPKPHILALPHWSALPFGMLTLSMNARRQNKRIMVMPPGGAIAWGALGYVSAGLELAMQVAAGALPCPRAVVLPVGSNCTTAGLLLGFALAARLQLGFAAARPPPLLAVRVTPWPITTRYRIVRLARAAATCLHQLTGDPRCNVPRATLSSTLHLDTSQLGRGYGLASGASQRAVARWRRLVGHPLDTTYSGKAAAAFIQLAQQQAGPILFWSTKTSTQLPPVNPAALGSAPAAMRRWLKS